MWAAVIIVLVIAMVVGPVMLMRPSKRDQYLAKLRASAREQGVQVSSSRLKDASGSLCWFYWRPLENNDENKKPAFEPIVLERKPYQHDLHVADFFEITKGKTVPAGFDVILKGLPESVQGVELNRHAVGVHWSERGGEEVLTNIAGALTQLLGLLRR